MEDGQPTALITGKLMCLHGLHFPRGQPSHEEHFTVLIFPPHREQRMKRQGWKINLSTENPLKAILFEGLRAVTGIFTPQIAYIYSKCGLLQSKQVPFWTGSKDTLGHNLSGIQFSFRIMLSRFCKSEKSLQLFTWHWNECDPSLHKHQNIHCLLFFILLKSGAKQCPSQLITWITFIIYYIKITGCPIIVLNTSVIICLMAYTCVEYACVYTYIWGCLYPCAYVQRPEEATLCPASPLSLFPLQTGFVIELRSQHSLLAMVADQKPQEP